MKIRVRVWGGVSFLNALISGFGSAMAVKLPLEVEIKKSMEWDCDDIAREIFKASGLEGRYSVSTFSKIPVGMGLKSSSAYTAAIAIGAQAIKGHVEPEIAVSVSAKVSKKMGISYTGAYDDAYAAVYGGIVISDNIKGSLLKRNEAPQNWLITIGLKEGAKKTVNWKALSSFSELGKVVLKHLEKGDYYFASTLNSLIVASASGYPADPIVNAAKAGLIAGISGNGPAYFAISEGSNYRFNGMKNIFTEPANEKYSVEVLSDGS
ncbi:MAG: shikimate kinase [Nitrososphaeria archaeon]